LAGVCERGIGAIKPPGVALRCGDGFACSPSPGNPGEGEANATKGSYTPNRQGHEGQEYQLLLVRPGANRGTGVPHMRLRLVTHCNGITPTFAKAVNARADARAT